MKKKLQVPRSNHPFFRRRIKDFPMVIAHRGDSSNAPENTLKAFQMAFARGADVVELDLKVTRDSKLVVIHDMTIDRVSDGKGYVRDYTLNELKKLDAGFRFTTDDGKTFPYRGKGLTIPTIDETLRAFPKFRFMLDLHSGGKDVVGPLVKVLKDHGRECDILIAAESAYTIRCLERAVPDCAFGGGISDAISFTIASAFSMRHLYVPKTDSIQLPNFGSDILVPNRSQVNFAHSYGLNLHVFTVNDEKEMVKLIKMGVDGIITDRPGLLNEIFYMGL